MTGGAELRDFAALGRGFSRAAHLARSPVTLTTIGLGALELADLVDLVDVDPVLESIRARLAQHTRGVAANAPEAAARMSGARA